MKSLSSLPLISAVIALCVAPAYAGNKPAPVKDPCPGNSKKCTRVDFDHDNNGWGNGDQDAPGNSGGNNNAENGPGGSKPGNSSIGNNGFGNGDQNPPGNSGGNNNAENGPDGNKPGNSNFGNNGFGNGDQNPPGNSGDNNNAENDKDKATQIELQRIESEALAKIALQKEAAKVAKPASTPAEASTTNVAGNIVARRAK